MKMKSRCWVWIVWVALLLMSGQLVAAAPLELTLQGHPGHMEGLESIIEEYNASQDRIKVTILSKEANAESITAAQLANQLPDIIESGVSFTNDYARQGLMAPLDDFIAREGGDFLSDFYPATLSTYQINGKLYSLPAFLQMEGMYYNSEVLSEVGVPAPQSGWTWRDLKELAQRARRLGPDGNKEIWGLVAGHPVQFDFVLLGQAGGAFITSDYQVAVNSEPVRETYNWILDMINEELLDYRGLHPDAPDTNGWAHRSAFVVDASYRQNTWDKEESANITAPPLRRDAGSEPATIFTDRSWAIMAVAQERQEAAWEVVKYLVRAENAARFAVSLGYPPATRSAVSHEIFQEYSQTRPNVLRWAEMYGPIQAVNPWPSGLWGPASSYAYPMATSLLKKEITIGEFIENLQSSLTAVVTEFLEREK